LLHPLIRQEIQQDLIKSKSPYCIVVIPLLIETQPNPMIDRILVIDTSEETQKERAKKRDDISDTQIAAILQSQATRQQRLSAADDLINNTTNLEDLQLQVKKMHEFYLTLSKVR
jgi:dephospho-CoA kinase